MRLQKTSTLTIRTPEGITFSLLLAGPVTRFLAWAIDLICITMLGIAVALVLRPFGLLSQDVAAALTLWCYFAISIGYGILLEWFWRGQTVGKRFLRLRVVDERGLRLQPSQIVMRNLLRFVDILPAGYLVGGISALLSRRCQRLGDLAANTVVIRSPRIREPDLDTIAPGKYNSFRDHPHLAARARSNLTPQEAAIALRSVLRRERLTPEARVPLFRELAKHFRRIVDFPSEATEGLSDEQYVRNLVDVIYRPQLEKQTADST